MSRNESRIAETFAVLRARGELGIIPYLTIGYPERESALELVPALVRGGACAIELGIPFSDPLADGVTIQRASHVALQNGVTVRYCLETAARLREAGVDVPFVFMGYFNPLLQYGLEQFVRACVEVGVDGVIVPDLPPIESDELHALCRAAGRDLIFMVAPTSTERHLREVAARASGFLYCVSLTGVTGARDRLPDDLPAFLQRVRAVTDLPLALGFGISRPDHVAQAHALVDAVVVGSALLDRIAAAQPGERAAAAEAFIAWLRTGTAATVGEGS
ncbi:Tryptophan synthase alpha chain [bacterium HR27]|nr:Tryptophan synthase alpha chain [bacterium HR27]